METVPLTRIDDEKVVEVDFGRTLSQLNKNKNILRVVRPSISLQYEVDRQSSR